MRGSSSHAALGLIVAALALSALASQRAPPAEAPVPPRREAASVQTERALREGQRIELNAATAADLTLLPGIGPRLAQRIVDERARRGGFAQLDELLAVRGMGPKTLSRVRPLLELHPLRSDRTDTRATAPP